MLRPQLNPLELWHQNQVLNNMKQQNYYINLKAELVLVLGYQPIMEFGGVCIQLVVRVKFRFTENKK